MGLVSSKAELKSLEKVSQPRGPAEQPTFPPKLSDGEESDCLIDQVLRACPHVPTTEDVRGTSQR